MSTNRFFILFAFLLACNTVPAQKSWPGRDSAFVRKIDLPRPHSYVLKEMAEANNGPYIYIMGHKDISLFFGYDTMMRYREFNFTAFHIFGVLKCRQCMLFCRHEEGIGSCHRNSCMLRWAWSVRDNAKAFTPVNSTALPFWKNSRLKTTGIARFTDTVLMPSSPADSGLVHWHTTGYGDCHAWFTYALFSDNYHPVLLMREWSHSGGCRAAGSRSATIRFGPVPGVLYYRKNTVRADH